MCTDLTKSIHSLYLVIVKLIWGLVCCKQKKFFCSFLFALSEFYFYVRCNIILNLKAIITWSLLYMFFNRKCYLLEYLLQEIEFIHQNCKAHTSLLVFSLISVCVLAKSSNTSTIM